MLGFEEPPEFNSRIEGLYKRLEEVKGLYNITSPMKKSEMELKVEEMIAKMLAKRNQIEVEA